MSEIDVESLSKTEIEFVAKKALEGLETITEIHGAGVESCPDVAQTKIDYIRGELEDNNGD